MLDSMLTAQISRGFTAADADLLTKAYAFAEERACGNGPEPFQAAKLLLDHSADALTIAGALIAPLLWQGLAESGEVRKHFDRTVAVALEDLLSPSVLRINTPQSRQKDFHALLAFMSSSPRKAMLLIAFRLLALENATDPRGADVRQMARETLDFCVPIASRLSPGELHRRLEDACFHILDPAGYEYLKQEVAAIYAKHDRCLRILLTGVQRLLNTNGIQGYVQGRIKGLQSIHRKMIRKGKSLQEIRDRIGLRIIVISIPQCYAVLGLLHTQFRPIPGTFDDYIRLPKPNGYRSLHTCVFPASVISDLPIEFQVRTESMHAEAEQGTAAHWCYKRETTSAVEDRDQPHWLEGAIHQHRREAGSSAFIGLLHREVFQDQLVVFRNGRRVVHLPPDSTVADCLNPTGLNVVGVRAQR